MLKFQKKIKFAFVSFGAFIFYNIPIEYMTGHYTVCLFKLILERECIGCGTIRGFWCILHFQFEEAFRFNQTIFITFPLFIFCILYWTFNMDFRKFKRNFLGI
ncbi:DUF2752 domain-containing protein [Leptospira interrogans]|uniref:PF10825 family protein n=4 Tax=Leptospira interrogans TaxID=173 RepID=A0A0E2D6I9_LEPIR|nr:MULTISPECIES: DUF2752 domain-containing protein [Leptospira]EMF42328.1 PF10825 family protein [Leptospira interrogans serovar Lora str. TE 1992]AKH78255.1 hypothetical protein BRAT_15175 [Leptospira interrogans serovar Bratislava]EJO80397.1 PF10825 family protein [Leptospira interrogans serovar Pomona str. Kennewicki LC82-25]EKN97550.1 PF10825 family protein [Leptospira interrogans serovar Pomona str. Pomona]EKR38117.1 PF10825 family protein [Leptospira interrogans serovar Hebdomadis str. R